MWPTARPSRADNYNAASGVDGLVVDHTNYYFDLAASIYNRSLVHSRLYSAREEYDLADLSAASWDGLVRRAAAAGPDGEKTFAKFRSNYYRRGPATANACKASCRKKMLCHLVSTCMRVRTYVQRVCLDCMCVGSLFIIRGQGFPDVRDNSKAQLAFPTS